MCVMTRRVRSARPYHAPFTARRDQPPQHRVAWPGRYCSPRHRMEIKSTRFSKRLMTWQAITARPCGVDQHVFRGGAAERGAAGEGAARHHVTACARGARRHGVQAPPHGGHGVQVVTPAPPPRTAHSVVPSPLIRHTTSPLSPGLVSAYAPYSADS